MGGFGFFLIIIAFFFLYFVLVRPQKRRQLQQQQMLNAVKVGDEIVTAGGMYGEIREVRDDERDRPDRAGPRRSRGATRDCGRQRPPSRRSSRSRSRPAQPPVRRPGTLPGPVSERRKYLLLMSAIAAAVVGALLIAIPGSPAYQKPVLGLDLQGGLEVVLQAVPPKGHTLTPADLDRSISIMQSRINKLGVSEPEIRKQGKDQIVIQLAGVHDPEAAAALIGKTAQLMLFDFENDLTGPSIDTAGNPVASPGLYALLKQVQTQANKGEPEAFYLFKNKTVTKKPTKKGGKPTTTVEHSLVDARLPRQTELLKRHGGKVPQDGEVLKVPAHMLVVRCAASTGCLGAGSASKTGTYYYLMKYYPQAVGKQSQIPEMTGGDLVLSGTRADFGADRLAGRAPPVHEPRLRASSRRSPAKKPTAASLVHVDRQPGRLHELRAALRDRARRRNSSRRRTSTSSATRTGSRARTRRSTSAGGSIRRRRTSRSSSRPVRCR